MPTKHRKDAIELHRVIPCGSLRITAGLSTDANGQPVREYVKDLIRAGDWYKASTGQQFSLTEKDLDTYVSTFARMNKSGVKVYVPAGHTNDPEKNRGYVTAMWREGQTLFARIQLIGEDAVSMASRSEVSVCIVPEIVAGDGTKFSDAIEHVALVSDPVINGQGKFVPIAASRGLVQAPVYRLAQENSMDALKKIAAKLGIEVTDAMDETALSEAIDAKIGAMQTEMSAAKKTVEASTAEIKASRDKIATLEKDKGLPTANADVLEARAESVELKLNKLAESGKIGLKAAKAFADLLIGTPDKRPALALSREVASAAGLTAPLADSVLAALEQNDPVSTGIKTGSQSLSRSVPGDNGQISASRTQEVIKEQLNRAGVKS